MKQYFNLKSWSLKKLRARLEKKNNILLSKYPLLEEAIKDNEPLDEQSLFKQIDNISTQIVELEEEIFTRL